MNNFLNSVISNKFLSKKEKLILEILEVYSPRISEILEAKWLDFQPDFCLVLKGKKHSRDVVIHDRSILDQINKLPRQHEQLIFYPVKYKTMYDRIKRDYGHLFRKYKKKKNEKITHGFRFKNAEKLRNPHFVTALLNHSSTKTKKYYRKDLPQK